MDASATPDLPGAPSWTSPRLRVDRDGQWYDGDVEVTHAGIVANLRSNLRRDGEGYFIQTRVRIPVEVEDVPFVVMRLARQGETLWAWLNDGSEAPLDPASLRIGAGEVPYAAVKEGRFEARLSRAATFQLWALATEDAASGQSAVEVGGRRYPLRRAG